VCVKFHTFGGGRYIKHNFFINPNLQELCITKNKGEMKIEILKHITKNKGGNENEILKQYVNSK